jgi:hypothetical protein
MSDPDQQANADSKDNGSNRWLLWFGLVAVFLVGGEIAGVISIKGLIPALGIAAPKPDETPSVEVNSSGPCGGPIQSASGIINDNRDCGVEIIQEGQQVPVVQESKPPKIVLIMPKTASADAGTVPVVSAIPAPPASELPPKQGYTAIMQRAERSLKDPASLTQLIDFVGSCRSAISGMEPASRRRLPQNHLAEFESSVAGGRVCQAFNSCYAVFEKDLSFSNPGLRCPP